MDILYFSELELKQPEEDDAGIDIPLAKDVVIPAHATVKIETEFTFELPKGHCGLLFERSSAADMSLLLLGRVIDPSYRGKISLSVHNLSHNPRRLRAGERIAQMVVVPYAAVQLTRTAASDALTPTKRGKKGYGSTGK